MPRRRGATKPASSRPGPSQPVVAAQSAAPEPASSGRVPASGRRTRKPRVTYSPAVVPTRAYRRREVGPPEDPATVGPDAACRRLEARVRGYVKQLKYFDTFLEAYEGDGWRRASLEKIKPRKELTSVRNKILPTKRLVVTALREMQTLQASEPRVPFLVKLEKEGQQQQQQQQPTESREAEREEDRIDCSRCHTTETTVDNDILLCDFPGCCRAFHQRCQSPAVATTAIPAGDAPWYCTACLALFNALKCINYAFDTRWERVEDVFPDLDEEEQAAMAGDTGGLDGRGEENHGDDEDDDDDDDEDFAIEDAVEDGVGSESSSDSDDESEDGGEREKTVDVEEIGDENASDISEDELRYLRQDDVIDQLCRTTRSKGGASKTAPDGGEERDWRGQRVAIKDPTSGQLLFAIVVEKIVQGQEDVDNNNTANGNADASEGTAWRVVCEEDHKLLRLSTKQVEQSAALADSQTHNQESGLILGGKRKRTRVDYRQLNDLLFAGQQDSDDEADADHRASLSGPSRDDGGEEEEEEEELADEEEEAEEEEFQKVESQSEEGSAPKRGRRARSRVDYRAMHEGVLTF